MADSTNPDSTQDVGGNQVDNLIELFRTALMVAHSNDWDMETVAEAAHICANAFYQSQAKSSTAFVQADKTIGMLLDAHSRDMAVLGLKNHGYSTTAMEQTEKLTKRLTQYFAEVSDLKPSDQEAKVRPSKSPSQGDTT